MLMLCGHGQQVGEAGGGGTSPKQSGMTPPTFHLQDPASAVPLGSRAWGHAIRLPSAGEPAAAPPPALPPGAPGLGGAVGTSQPGMEPSGCGGGALGSRAGRSGGAGTSLPQPQVHEPSMSVVTIGA